MRRYELNINPHRSHKISREAESWPSMPVIANAMWVPAVRLGRCMGISFENNRLDRMTGCVSAVLLWRVCHDGGKSASKHVGEMRVLTVRFATSK